MNQSQAPPKTSALAIWSLVLGILGLLCFSLNVQVTDGGKADQSFETNGEIIR